MRGRLGTYLSLNRIADKRFAEHLESLKPKKGE
jgi:hypothetical protein